MKVTVIGGVRRDGKYKVKLYFPGGPNMFGGFYHGKVFTKLMTPGKLRTILDSPALEEANDVPLEMRA